jgi:hypothetical protein
VHSPFLLHWVSLRAAGRSALGTPLRSLGWRAWRSSRRYLAGFASAPAEVLTVKLADRYSNVQRLDTHPRPAKRSAYYAETVRVFLPLAQRSPYFSELFRDWAAHFAGQLG